MVFLHIDTKNYDEKDENGETPIAIFNKFIKDGKHIFALIYMEGCGPCNATRPEWKKLEGVVKKGSMNDDDFLVVDIDKDMLDKVKNIGSEPKGFPTIRYINKNNSEDFEDSELNEEYKMRTIDSFIMWIQKKTNKQQGGKRKQTKLSKRGRKKMKGGKWSIKYKKSINCKRPKGFSQKQYCKYSRKRR
jgi:hypothetical protein